MNRVLEPALRALLSGMVLLIGVWGCKPLDFGSSKSKNVDTGTEPAQVTGSLCDRLGGSVTADNTCRCENGVATFKLLGQTCATVLARQKSGCSSQGGQILYDDDKCLCFPEYDAVPAGGKCQSSYPKNTLKLVATAAEQNPKGACPVLEKAGGTPHDICFEYVDLEGCDRSFQVAFEQMKPEFYEIVFFPGKNCTDAKLALKTAVK